MTVLRALRSLPTPLLEALLIVRGLLSVGSRYRCPCCGWNVRAFTAGGLSLRARAAGYCPRYGSKARHRRIWLFLDRKTNLFSEPLDLLEIAPRYCFSRRFVRMPNLRFVGADLVDGPNVSIRMDLTASPLPSSTFDAIICVHVLEEIEDDRAAMSELFRMLRPGGWTLISVPTRMNRTTYEDLTITAPKDRQRAFGEAAHVRIYGHDLVDRLEGCGFHIAVDRAGDVDPETRERYGLRDDENIFFCTKPAMVSRDRAGGSTSRGFSTDRQAIA